MSFVWKSYIHKLCIQMLPFFDELIWYVHLDFLLIWTYWSRWYIENLCFYHTLLCSTDWATESALEVEKSEGYKAAQIIENQTMVNGATSQIADGALSGRSNLPE